MVCGRGPALTAGTVERRTVPWQQYSTMSEPALITSQSGRLTRGLPALVAARGYEPVSTLVTDRPEDGQYYVSPGTIDRIEQRAADTGRGRLTLVVDGVPHPGQLADLRARLQSVSVRDKRRVVWEHLAEKNPVAATCIELQTARIARQQAVDSQRGAATRSPSGTSGRLADIDSRIVDLRDALERRQRTASQRVQTSYTGADARVVLLGRGDAPTTVLWTALTDGSTTPGTGRPARPVTSTATVGPHTLAVTDTPGVPGSDGIPHWLTRAVPGLSTALTQATCVLGVGEGEESLLRAVSERFDVLCRSLDSVDAATARTVLADLLEATTYVVRLPYTDEAHALVSELHDRATVTAIKYDEAVSLRVEVARTATDELRRRVDALDGKLEVLDTNE